MPPSQRIRLLVRHLHEFGWKPVIFTVDPYYREETEDPWMVEITGDAFEKIVVKTWDQRKTRKFGLGDLGIRSFYGMYRALLKQAKKEKPALILYPVPPWYMMIMAPFIKKRTRVPYIIDFIDPWLYPTNLKDFKTVVSQRIAKLLEGRVVRNSNAIIAVSQGILDDLVKRCPSISSRPMAPIPYGVEVSDFDAIQVQKKENNNRVEIRYTGAISENMLSVVDSLLKALKKVNQLIPLRVIFTGTSYAGVGLVKPMINGLIAENGVADFVVENPARVGYRQALEINKQADMLLLVGDTTPYYAASKMMGLVASGIPFFAWVHEDSFPGKFLRELEYPNRLVYQTDEIGTDKKVDELYEKLVHSIQTRKDFVRVSLENPVFKKFTAKAMTGAFVETFQKII
jgi:hypothetical protein